MISFQDIEVVPFRAPDPNRQYISSMMLDIDFYSKKKTTSELYNSDEMAKEFLMQFASQVQNRISVKDEFKKNSSENRTKLSC